VTIYRTYLVSFLLSLFLLSSMFSKPVLLFSPSPIHSVSPIFLLLSPISPFPERTVPAISDPNSFPPNPTTKSVKLANSRTIRYLQTCIEDTLM